MSRTMIAVVNSGNWPGWVAQFTDDGAVMPPNAETVRGTYSLKVTPPGVTVPIADRGKFLEIWRKQADGSWKISHDMFNSDVPLPPPAPSLDAGKKKEEGKKK